nr:retrovirus-related Pol polyprotein from transposon TNT 1-94 [Tanacetum cinerariifolium]
VEAVNTACYVINRALVIKPHNKTPYELIRGRPPLIDFMKPFWCPVTILNTKDYLGKFDEKADKGFFVGYFVKCIFSSTCSYCDSNNDTGIFGNAYDDEAVKEEVDKNNVDSSYTIPDAPLTKFFKDHPKVQVIDKWAIGTKWVFRNKKDERRIVVKNKAKLVAQGHTQEEGINYDEKELSTKFEKLMHDKFQISSMGELSFFLGLQVQQKSDEIFISQEKYVVDILKKFDFTTVKIASTPMEPNKALVKDTEAKDTTTKVKKVNGQEQIQALVDKQKLIITEESTRCNLKFDDAEEKDKDKEKTEATIEVHSPSSEIPIEESIPTPSNDLLPSGEDSIQLNELMIFYTNLQQQVLDLEEAKITQAKEIANLNKRVKKLEKRRKSRPAGLRRLKKVGSSKQVESYKEIDSLGAQEDASKQGRSIKDIDQDAEIALFDEAQGRMHDADMFGFDDLESDEVIVYVREKIVKKEVSTADPVTTTGEVVNTASVEDSVALTTATTADVDDELTLAKTLITIKATKVKVISNTATIVTTAITTPRAKGIVFHKQVLAHILTVSSSKDKATIDADRRKYFAAKRAKEIRNKSPTEAQQKSIMCTYMKNMEGFKQKDFKGKSFDDIKKIFDKVYKRVNTFVDMNIENVEESLKITQAEEQAKEADDDTTDLKRCLEIVPEDDDDVAIKATPLSSKSPTISVLCYNKDYGVLSPKMYPFTNSILHQLWSDVRLQVDYELVLLVYKVTVVFNKVNAAKSRVTTTVRVSTAGWIKWLKDQDMHSIGVFKGAHLWYSRDAPGGGLVRPAPPQPSRTSSSETLNLPILCLYLLYIYYSYRDVSNFETGRYGISMPALTKDHKGMKSNTPYPEKLNTRLDGSTGELNEMWEAIERLQQGESLNIQDLKTNLIWEFGKFTSRDGETMESSYTGFYKQYQKEVNELRVKRLARNANPLALVDTAQSNQDPYYQTSKSHKSHAPSSKPLILTRSHTTARYKGKKIAKSIIPPSETASKEDNDPEQAQRDKDMQKNLALIAKNKRTVNVAGARENVDSLVVQQFGIQCFNCKEFRHFAKECRKLKRVKDSAYDKEKMLLCKQAEQAGYNVFANDLQHSEQSESISNTCLVETDDSNVIPNSLDMCDDNIQNDQNDVESDDELVKEKHDELIKQILLTKSHYEGFVKQKTMVITDLKLRKEHDIDKMLSMEKQLKFLNEIVYKRSQSIQTIHMMAPKQEMHADLKYIESLEKQIDELEFDKAEFSNMYDMILQECISKDVMCSYLLSLSNLDALDELQCLYLHKVKECDYLAQKLSKQTESVSKKHRSNQLKDKFVPNNSQVKLKKTQVEVHPRIPSVPNKMKSVTAWKDNLNSKTLNVNAVCATCNKCLVDSNHFACVTKMLNDVNARTKKPNVVPISNRKPKGQANKSIATPHKKKVASKSTNQKPQSYFMMMYETTSKTWKWRIAQQSPSGYIWVPKTKMQWIIQLIIFIVDSGCMKHMTGNLKLLCNFVEKFLATVHFGNDQFAPILGYGDLVQGNVTINRVYYVEGLNHNLFSVGQFCDADLEKDIVIGLPKLKYVKDQLCSSCELSKAKRSSFKSKATPSLKGMLNLLHMDLCGPMRVASINGKKYILVIVDDYSRYTWTLFLHSKDETPKVLKEFLTMIQRNLQAPMIIVRTDRDTTFLNKTLILFFKEEGIEHQTSTDRTPEQNGVVERQNRTLVEAARTMLLASKLSL